MNSYVANPFGLDDDAFLSLSETFVGKSLTEGLDTSVRLGGFVGAAFYLSNMFDIARGVAVELRLSHEHTEVLRLSSDAFYYLHDRAQGASSAVQAVDAAVISFLDGANMQKAEEICDTSQFEQRAHAIATPLRTLGVTSTSALISSVALRLLDVWPLTSPEGELLDKVISYWDSLTQSLASPRGDWLAKRRKRSR